MKLEKICPHCMKDQIKSNSTTSSNFRLGMQPLLDSAVHDVTCDKGHSFTLVYSGIKSEMLFDIAMSAIRDGYPREAVSSFAASLERFYEFYIEYCTLGAGIEKDTFKKVWKPLSNRSERQLGAYVFLYLLKNKKEPMLLNNNDVSFRNKVVHKGYIPTEAEALKFGKSIYQLVMSVASELEDSDGLLFKKFYQSKIPNTNPGKGFSITAPKGIYLIRTLLGGSELNFEQVNSLYFSG